MKYNRCLIYIGIVFLNNITTNNCFTNVKYYLTKRLNIHNNHLTMLRENNNTKIRNMFNDHIYNRVNNTLLKMNNNDVKEVKKDLKKEVKKVENYASNEEKFFAPRHIFGMSDYDFTIIRISIYIVITSYCIAHWIVGVIKSIN
jgi:hypothetical protein